VSPKRAARLSAPPPPLRLLALPPALDLERRAVVGLLAVLARELHLGLVGFRAEVGGVDEEALLSSLEGEGLKFAASDPQPVIRGKGALIVEGGLSGSW